VLETDVVTELRPVDSVPWKQTGHVCPPDAQLFAPVDFLLSDTGGRPCWDKLTCTCGGKVCYPGNCMHGMTGVIADFQVALSVSRGRGFRDGQFLYPLLHLSRAVYCSCEKSRKGTHRRFR
jgi:hypothetical protein